MPRSTSSETSYTRAPARRGHGNPGALIGLGLLMLGFALLVLTLQTQTNEAYINHAAVSQKVLQAQWSIWLQIPKLVFGSGIPGPDIGPDDLPGIVIGQGVELVYLSLIAGFQIATHSSQKFGKVLGVIIVVFLLAIAIFDFWTDLAYGNISSEAHFIFAVFCTFVIGFFPTWGLALIEHGWKRL